MRKLVFISVAVAVVAALVVVSIRLFVRPATSAVPKHADAVALLSGGAGDRLPVAERLMRQGVAPVLVIPNGHDPKWAEANRLCAGGQPFEVVCPDPSPDTTRGEAEAIGRLANERRWRRVALVTSQYHVTRAGLLTRRCVDGSVAMVASKPDASALQWTRYVLHEWAGLLSAVTLHRAC